MRSILLPILALLSAISAGAPALAEPGTMPERVSHAGQVDEGMGVVVISLRSELYLDEPMQLFFLREGGSVENDADVVHFGRRQGFFALGNDTLSFKIRSYQLRPGTYRLVAHGMDCSKVPAENERCLIDEPGPFGTVERSRPSRGYPEIAPTFEVEAGAVTYAGDYILTARNQIEWMDVPREEVLGMERKFAGMVRAPDPIIPGEYRLKYGLTARSWDDDAGRRY